MQLTRFTDLGLRIVTQLAETTVNAADHPDGSHPRTTTSSVSEAINASQTHVAKVVSRLADMGVIRSSRGRTGGILLAPDALDFSLGNLIKELEGDEDIIDRLRDGSVTMEPSCPLTEALMEAQDAFFDVLNTRTIRDIVPTNNSADSDSSASDAFDPDEEMPSGDHVD